MMKIYTVVLLFTIINLFYLPNSAANSAKNDVSQVQMVKVNINTAPLEELTLLTGIGTKKAMAIIEYRKKYGKFKSIDELTKVKGIGDTMIKKLKDQIKVS